MMIKRERVKPSEYEVCGDVCTITLYGMKGNVTGKVIIDTNNIEKCKKVKWFIKNRRNKPVCVAGHTEEKRNMRIHHFLFGYLSEGQEYDHINRNPLDNRKENLRVCNFNQNQRNQGLRRTNTSGYKGVTKNQYSWLAQIWENGNHFHLGSFKKKEEAALAYNAAAQRLHKDFAYLNQI
jgi:hypothetical protein